MTVETKIMGIENRIALLKARGETMNMRLIRKLERRRRALLGKQQ